MELMNNQQLPKSKHFRIEELVKGIYAAIHIDGGAAICNAGIIDLGDRTLVFDTFMSPQAAKDLRIAAEGLTGRPIDAVVDSHFHNDHCWGNQAFDPSTEIISTEETRRLILATKEPGNIDDDLINAEANLEGVRAEYAAEQNESRRRQLAFAVDYRQTIVDLKPILKIKAPNLTFSQQLIYRGKGRTVELIDFAGGHTESDVVLFIPEEGIAFMSDLLFINFHPYMGRGDPDKLIHNLEAVSKLSPRILVPGHGPIGTVASLAQMIEYINMMDDLASNMVKAGKTENAIKELAIPKPYESWLCDMFFPANMHFLYMRHALRIRAEKTYLP
jgi:cyclase